MLLSNWRIRLLHIGLTGMEVVWLLPILIARFPNTQTFTGYLFLFVLALVWLLVYDLIDLQQWPAALRQAILLAGYALVTTLWMWTAVYHPAPLFPLNWLGLALGKVVSLDNGITSQAIVFGLSTWLWLRAAWSARRNLTSLAIEHSLRNGMLFLLAGAGLVQGVTGQSLSFWLPALYLGFGISALSLARSDERHALAHVRGGAPPARRLMQFMLIALIITSITTLASRFLPAPLSKGLSWLGVVAEIIIILLQLAFVAALLLGIQIINWLQAAFNTSVIDTSQINMPSQGNILDVMAEQLEQQQGRDFVLPEWAIHALKYFPIVIVIIAVILIFILINRAVYRRRLRADEETESEAGFSARKALRNGLNHLRNLADMSRKFRLGEGLLAAISVEAIYANVCRLAAQLGAPRPKAMPAESYLPVLRNLFEDLDGELERITRAYMRVHYGDQKVRTQNLINLQRDYARLRRAATKAK